MRQARGRGFFVPQLAIDLGLLQPVAHKLLVVAGRVFAFGQGFCVALDGPVARAVGREHLVHQHQGAVLRQAKFKLGIGNDHAFLQGDFGRLLVQADRGVANLRGQLFAHHLHRALVGDVFVVVAHLGLGRRGVDRCGQLGRIGQPRRQGHAANGLAVLVFLPAAARQIAAHHGLDQDRLQALHQHGAVFDLGNFFGRDHALRRFAGQVVGANMAQLGKPKQRHLGQQLALARNGFAHDHVKGRQAIAGHHQNAVIAHRVVVTHLATRQEGQRSNIGSVQGRGARRSHSAQTLNNERAHERSQPGILNLPRQTRRANEAA